MLNKQRQFTTFKKKKFYETNAAICFNKVRKTERPTLRYR